MGLVHHSSCSTAPSKLRAEIHLENSGNAMQFFFQRQNPRRYEELYMLQ